MSGAKIRILYSYEPPDSFTNCKHFPTLWPNFECPFPGSTIEIVSMLAAYLNWTIIPTVYKVSHGRLNYGSLLPNGSYNGMLGYITRNEVDTICTLTQYKQEMENSPFELSYPVKLTYLTRKLPALWQDSLLNALVPYSTITWIVILASLVIQILFGVFIRKSEVSMKLLIDFSAFKTFWQYARYQVLQPDDDIFVYYKTSAGNWAYFIFGLLQVSLLTNLYQGLLLSALLQKPNLNPFQTSAQMFNLIASGRYTYVVDAINYYSDWYESNWNNTDVAHVRQLNDALKSNPPLVPNTTEEALALVQKGGYIFPTQDDTYESYVIQSYCDLYKFSEDTPQKSSMFIFLKNNTLMKEWNRAIIMNQAFIQRTFRKYYSNGFITSGIFPNSTVDPNDKIPDAMKPLDLWAVSGIILLLLIGHVVSLVAFLAEWLLTYTHTRVKKSKSVKLKLNSMKDVKSETFRQKRNSTQISHLSFADD